MAASTRSCAREARLLEIDEPGFRAFGAGILQRELAAQNGASGRIDHFEDVLEPDQQPLVI